MTRLILYMKRWRIFRLTIAHAWPRLREAVVLYMILILTISLPLFCWMGPYMFNLHVFELAIMTVIKHPFAPTEDFDVPIFERGRFPALLFITFTTFCFRVMVFSFFAIILVSGWKLAKHQIYRETWHPYSFWNYVQEKILRRSIKLDGSRKHHATCRDRGSKDSKDFEVEVMLEPQLTDDTYSSEMEYISKMKKFDLCPRFRDLTPDQVQPEWDISRLFSFEPLMQNYVPPPTAQREKTRIKTYLEMYEDEKMEKQRNEAFDDEVIEESDHSDGSKSKKKKKKGGKSGKNKGKKGKGKDEGTLGSDISDSENKMGGKNAKGKKDGATDEEIESDESAGKNKKADKDVKGKGKKSQEEKSESDKSDDKEEKNKADKDTKDKTKRRSPGDETSDSGDDDGVNEKLKVDGRKTEVNMVQIKHNVGVGL